MSNSFATPCTVLPASPVHGISQARILEWVAISFSRESSRLRDWTCICCISRQILYHRATSGDPYWIRVDLNPMTVVLIRKGTFWQRYTEEREPYEDKQILEWCNCKIQHKLWKVRDSWQQTEAPKRQERLSRAFRGSVVLSIHWFQSSRLQILRK